jgi:hypothetical protein
VVKPEVMNNQLVKLDLKTQAAQGISFHPKIFVENQYAKSAVSGLMVK